ncbi:dihydroorotate dehydrogenase-like protein [Paenirhodobacter sp.]|uniref:dihydroorotate dehydrogenase-like protein n=1 Tax=Paenirhodobacter sp. TaxID=1965326 RepID=UPI003B3CA762
MARLATTPDLSTQYAGLTLRNPIVASPSPENAHLPWLKRLDAAGIGAVVLPSLFQEQMEAQDRAAAAVLAQTQDNNPEAQSYLPTSVTGPYGVGPEEYLDLIRTAKAELSVPVIASLNGSDVAGWVEYAAEMEKAGADALELNIYYVPVDITQSGTEMEARYLRVLEAVRAQVRLPIIVKIPPFFSSVGHMAGQLVAAGANGLVIFNRYIQPDIELARLRLSRRLELSAPAEMRLPLLWTAVLAGRVDCALAASCGVEGPDEVVKFLLAGSDVVMTTSALLRHGPEYVTVLRDGLSNWLAARGLASVSQVRGVMSKARLRESGAYERANYIRLIETYSAEHA